MRKRWALESETVITMADMEEASNTQWLDDTLSDRYKARHTSPSDDFSDYDAFKGMIESCA